MSTGGERWARRFVGLLVAGVVVRGTFLRLEDGMYFPDQIFQYLEPANARITGSGWLAWEYAVGARNWSLPAFWGGWLELGRALGFTRVALYHFVMTISALLSALAIPAGYRLGKALGGDEAIGVWSAAAVACFPPLAYFGPHPLSENAAMVLTTWAFALHVEGGAKSVNNAKLRGFWVGALLGAACLCRTSSLVFVPAVLLDSVVRRQKRELLLLLSGLAALALVLALLDTVTWGRPWQSVVEFVAANREYERQLAAAGQSAPWHFYLEHVLWAWLGPVGLVLVLLSLPGLRRRGLTPLLFWALPLVSLSLLHNKQERFVVGVLPVLLATTVAGAPRALDALRLGSSLRARIVPVIAVGLCISALPGTLAMPLRAHAGTFHAQAFIGGRDDATGVLVGMGENANGGYLLMERSIPLAPFHAALLDHRLFNYVIANTPELEATLRARTDFRELRSFEGVAVFGR